MPRAHRKRAKRVKRTKIRLVKGHLSLKVAGYPGVHRFGASQLIQFVPLNKIKVAAKKLLSQSRVKRSSSSSSSSKRKRSVKQRQRKYNRNR